MKYKFCLDIAIVITLTVGVASSIGCNKPLTTASTGTEITAPGTGLSNSPTTTGICQPLVVAVSQDKTGSAEVNPTPQLRNSDLSPLYAALRCGGGEIGLNLITSNVSQNLERLRVEPPPVAPVSPGNDPNPLVMAEKMASFKTDRERYEVVMRFWNARTEQAIESFQQRIKRALNTPARFKRTDFNGSIAALTLFLNEPRPGWEGRMRRFYLVVSDAQDNVHSRPLSVCADARFLIVFGGEAPAPLKTFKPIRFEAIEPAVRYITIGKGGN
jgi:hypothetical protein